MRKNYFSKFILALVLSSVVYFECLVYKIQPFFWKTLDCSDDDPLCTKILFIADPQIQGEHSFINPVKFIVNWDSDRYLKLTFTEVMEHFQPHVLVFLGDLMDEGSTATKEEFNDYMERLTFLFDTDFPVVQVWLTGDNDIGGENEPIRKDKIQAFENAFSQPFIITFRNISFYKVNPLLNIYPSWQEKVIDTNYKFAVSHYSVTGKRMFAHQINKVIKPDIYFCAHEHESKYYKYSKELTDKRKYPIKGMDILRIPDKSEEIFEVFVPTCSYRMGTSNIGYGAAVLDRKKELHYTVLWSPLRFPHLFLYLVFIVLLILYCIMAVFKHGYRPALNMVIRRFNTIFY